MSLSLAAMGLASQFWQILLLATLSGVGNSVIHPPTTLSYQDRWTRTGWGGPSRCTRSAAISAFRPDRR